MLWLIWIALMLLVPAVAGVQVWWQVRRAATEATSAETRAGSGEMAPNQEA